LANHIVNISAVMYYCCVGEMSSWLNSSTCSYFGAT